MNWLMRRRELIAMQTEADGTKFYIQFTAANQTITLGYTQTVAGGTTVYWGDGTHETPETTTVSLSHTYSNAIGDKKTIIIAGELGTYALKSFGVKNTLTKFKGMEGITSIGSSVFSGCTALTEVNFPSTLTSIGSDCFMGCTGLTRFIIPEGVTTIGTDRGGREGARTFGNCTNLEYIKIPSTLTSVIGTWDSRTAQTFTGCPKLKTLGKGESYNIDTSVIVGSMFMSSALERIDIPYGVTTLPIMAFSDCTALTEVNFPSTLTSIGNSVFQGCTALTEIHCLRATPPTISSNTFSGLPATCTIYVPTGSLEAYQAAQYWTTYAGQMVEE